MSLERQKLHFAKSHSLQTFPDIAENSKAKISVRNITETPLEKEKFTQKHNILSVLLALCGNGWIRWKCIEILLSKNGPRLTIQLRWNSSIFCPSENSKIKFGRSTIEVHLTTLASKLYLNIQSYLRLCWELQRVYQSEGLGIARKVSESTVQKSKSRMSKKHFFMALILLCPKKVFQTNRYSQMPICDWLKRESAS